MFTRNLKEKKITSFPNCSQNPQITLSVFVNRSDSECLHKVEVQLCTLINSLWHKTWDQTLCRMIEARAKKENCGLQLMIKDIVMHQMEESTIYLFLKSLEAIMKAEKLWF